MCRRRHRQSEHVQDRLKPHHVRVAQALDQAAQRRPLPSSISHPSLPQLGCICRNSLREAPRSHREWSLCRQPGRRARSQSRRSYRRIRLRASTSLFLCPTPSGGRRREGWCKAWRAVRRWASHRPPHSRYGTRANLRPRRCSPRCVARRRVPGPPGAAASPLHAAPCFRRACSRAALAMRRSEGISTG